MNLAVIEKKLEIIDKIYVATDIRATLINLLDGLILAETDYEYDYLMKIFFEDLAGETNTGYLCNRIRKLTQQYNQISN